MKNRVRELRQAREQTQEDLARVMDVSRQTINAIECGKHDPSLQLAFRLAGHFGLRIEELFDGAV